MNAPQPVDVLVIGGGPAGLTAATTLARQFHSVTVFDSGSYRNEGSYYMHTVPTWDHKNPEEFRAAVRKDVRGNYENVYVQQGIVIKNIKQTEDGLFEAQDSSGKTYTGRKLILATGCNDIYPEIEGYAECWGKGVFHCLFCHGYEERGGASSGVLAVQNMVVLPPVMHMARMAAQLCTPVTIYTNGSEQLAKDVMAAAGENSPFKIDSRPIKKLARSGKGVETLVHFEDGDTKAEAFLVHSPKTQLKGPFAQQLGLELTPMGDIKTTPPFLQTSVRGCFAAGDCMTPFKVVPNAIANGSMAAAGSSAQITAEKHGHKPLF